MGQGYKPAERQQECSAVVEGSRQSRNWWVVQCGHHAPLAIIILKSDHRLPLAGRLGDWICWLAMGRWMTMWSKLAPGWGMGALLLVAEAYLPRGRWNFPCKPVWTASESPGLSRLSYQSTSKLRIPTEICDEILDVYCGWPLASSQIWNSRDLSLMCSYIHLVLYGPLMMTGRAWSTLVPTLQDTTQLSPNDYRKVWLQLCFDTLLNYDSVT